MVDDLKQNKTDALVASAKSVLGAVPFAGPLLSELIGTLIPNQRLDRLTKYVQKLEIRFRYIQGEKIDKAFESEEGIDLAEESFVQASRALTDERRKYIANVVVNGIDDDAIEYSESKYLLKLLQELNEQEVIWLGFYRPLNSIEYKEYREKHKNVLEPIPAHFGPDERAIEKACLQKSYQEHLERIGLIMPHYRFDREAGIPKFDSFSGKPDVSYHSLTPLGRMLLRQIGFEESNG